MLLINTLASPTFLAVVSFIIFWCATDDKRDGWVSAGCFWNSSGRSAMRWLPVKQLVQFVTLFWDFNKCEGGKKVICVESEIDPNFSPMYCRDFRSLQLPSPPIFFFSFLFFFNEISKKNPNKNLKILNKSKLDLDKFTPACPRQLIEATERSTKLLHLDFVSHLIWGVIIFAQQMTPPSLGIMPVRHESYPWGLVEVIQNIHLLI